MNHVSQREVREVKQPEGNSPGDCLVSVQCAITAVRNNRTHWDRRKWEGLAAAGSDGIASPSRVGLLRLSRLLVRVTS